MGNSDHYKTQAGITNDVLPSETNTLKWIDRLNVHRPIESP